MADAPNQGAAVAAVASSAAALPSHVILETDWGAQLAGRVLPASLELIEKLKAAGVQYRAATAHEISIGGQ